jgi:1-deoxy-D-xylulose-5-phosphate synthase
MSSTVFPDSVQREGRAMIRRRHREAHAARPARSSGRRLLSEIRGPADVASLNLEELQALADELRETMVHTVSRTGGHLAASLGVVELTLAMLSVFDARQDKIIWDVGHQTYAWKLLTGRADRFHTLRRTGGISGFPSRAESPYDHFGTGHSSTSVSAAL